MIRYLTREEKGKTKAMYQENFPEDSQAFVDYYYTYKIKDNQILVMEEVGIQVMIHLNPYEFQVCGEPVRINYVVAVATAASVRRQGKMARVLKRALLDMAKERQPFTFLIPANPRVYQSAGFVFVPTEQYPEYEGQWISARQRQDLQAAEITGNSGKNLGLHGEAESGIRWNREADIRLRRATESDIPAMVAFANEFLSREYDIYPWRTAEYYRRMLAEMACQNGGLVLLEQVKAGTETAEGPKRSAGKLAERQRQPDTGALEYKTGLAGIFSYGREEENIELQEILVLPEYREEFPALVRAWFSQQPAEEDIRRLDRYPEAGDFAGQESSSLSPDFTVSRMDFMVRILDLKVLCLMLRSREPFVLRVQVQDDIIAVNEGSYEIRADQNGSSIRLIDPSETECTMEIGELTEFLFRHMRTFIREWV